jgi:hypothetical protein
MSRWTSGQSCRASDACSSGVSGDVVPSRQDRHVDTAMLTAKSAKTAEPGFVSRAAVGPYRQLRVPLPSPSRSSS